MIVDVKTVYAIRHNKTGRVYIGSSSRLRWRIKTHLNLLRKGKHKNELMQQDFNEFGEDYSFYSLDIIPTSDYRHREYYWMLFFDTYNSEKGYNHKDYTARNLSITDFPKIDLAM